MSGVWTRALHEGRGRPEALADALAAWLDGTALVESRADPAARAALARLAELRPDLLAVLTSRLLRRLTWAEVAAECGVSMRAAKRRGARATALLAHLVLEARAARPDQPAPSAPASPAAGPGPAAPAAAPPPPAPPPPDRPGPS